MTEDEQFALKEGALSARFHKPPALTVSEHYRYARIESASLLLLSWLKANASPREFTPSGYADYSACIHELQTALELRPETQRAQR